MKLRLEVGLGMGLRMRLGMGLDMEMSMGQKLGMGALNEIMIGDLYGHFLSQSSVASPCQSRPYVLSYIQPQVKLQPCASLSPISRSYPIPC